MRLILNSLLYKFLRLVLGILIGIAVTRGYVTDGQAHYVIEAGVPFLVWLVSAFVSTVIHHLKDAILLRTDPNAPITFAEIKAAARAAFFDMLRDAIRNFKEKDKSDAATK